MYAPSIGDFCDDGTPQSFPLELNPQNFDGRELLSHTVGRANYE
jgi:hypothetical protein